MPDGAVIYERSGDGAFRQAEILAAVTQLVRDTSVESETIPVRLINHPIAIVVSQDCDLDLDYRGRKGLPGPNQNVIAPDKQIPNVLLCDLFTAAEARGLSEIKSPIWSRIKTNSDSRYHFFQKVEPDLDAIGNGLPELTADFKRYFTIPADDLYAQLEKHTLFRRTRLKTPY